MEETSILAHDIGSTLLRSCWHGKKRDRHAPRIVTAILLNSAPYVEALSSSSDYTTHAATAHWPLIGKAMNERAFTRSLGRLFSEQHPLSTADAHQYWLAMKRDQGTHNVHELVQFIAEKKRYRQRWESALENSPVDLHFLLGLADPINRHEGCGRHSPASSIAEARHLSRRWSLSSSGASRTSGTGH